MSYLPDAHSRQRTPSVTLSLNDASPARFSLWVERTTHLSRVLISRRHEEHISGSCLTPRILLPTGVPVFVVAPLRASRYHARYDQGTEEGQRGRVQAPQTQRRPVGMPLHRAHRDRPQAKGGLWEDQAEAASKLARAIAERDGGSPVAFDPKKLTVAEYLNQWLTSTKSSISPRTYRRYDQTVRCHLTPALGGVVLAKLTPGHVEGLKPPCWTRDFRPGPRTRT